MREQKSGENRQNSFTWFLAKMMKFPLTAFANGLEVFVKTFHEMQRIADDGIEMFTGNAETAKPENFERRNELTGGSSNNAPLNKTGGDPGAGQSAGHGNFGGQIDNSANDAKTTVAERDLHDDLLKLVRYKVLFVKRDYEHAFSETESLIAENLDASTFTLWKVAEFIQQLEKGKTEVPEKWLTKSYPPPQYRNGSILKGMPDEDKKYLRVFYQVVERYEREKFKFEEQQIEVLEQIRDNIRLVAESDGKNGSNT